MGARGLGGLIEGLLVAEGFEVDKPAGHCLKGERMSADGRVERRLIWFADPEHGVQPETASLLADFEVAKDVLDESSLGFFVTPTLGGLSTTFRQLAHAAGVRIRVPVQFFDIAYKTDDGDGAFGEGGGSGASDVFRRFHRHGRQLAEGRVPQPYETLSELGGDAGGFGYGEDLFEHLLDELGGDDTKPGLTILVGNAGAGKSHLFAALFASLHERFLEAKRHQRSAMRPIAFLPEHIRDSRISSLDGLLEAVGGTQAGAATGLPLMRFLNREGFTLWMFDGLDEFFAGETDFVAALEAGLASDAHAHMLIAARDSLLTSSNALSGLIERNMGSGRVRLYELARWGRVQQEALARLRVLESGFGRPDQQVQDFLAAIDGEPAFAELATLPYYCSLMLDLGLGTTSGPLGELELLERAVDGLIDREQEKLASGEFGFGWDVFSGAETFIDMAELVEDWGVERFQAAAQRERLLEALTRIGRERLVELIEGMAHVMRTRSAFPNEVNGLTRDEIEALAAAYLDVGLVPDLEPRVLLAIVQFAFFRAGGETGRVRFAHEIIADYLAGRHAFNILLEDGGSAEAIGQALGVRQDLERSVMLRILVQALGRESGLAGVVAGHIEAGRVAQSSRQAGGQLLAALRMSGVHG